MHEGKYKYQITKQKLMEYAKELSEGAPLPEQLFLCGRGRKKADGCKTLKNFYG